MRISAVIAIWGTTGQRQRRAVADLIEELDRPHSHRRMPGQSRERVLSLCLNTWVGSDGDAGAEGGDGVINRLLVWRPKKGKKESC